MAREDYVFCSIWHSLPTVNQSITCYVQSITCSTVWRISLWTLYWAMWSHATCCLSHVPLC